MRVLLIVPAYNDEANIERVVQTIVDYAAQETAYQLDYIIINDGSTDNTAAICRERGFHTIHLVQNLGIGGAVQTGYLLANRKGYDAAVQFDGDGQHDIHSLSALLEPIMRDECDFVIGSRFLGTGEFRSTQMRRVGIRFLTGMIRLCSGCRLTDPTSGFRRPTGEPLLFCPTGILWIIRSRNLSFPCRNACFASKRRRSICLNGAEAHPPSARGSRCTICLKSRWPFFAQVFSGNGGCHDVCTSSD